MLLFVGLAYVASPAVQTCQAEAETPRLALTASDTARASYQLRLNARADLLEVAMQNAAADAASFRSWSFFNGVIFGAISFGAGAWILSREGAMEDIWALEFGGLSLFVGAIELVYGIIRGLETMAPERRLERWRSARARGPIDPVTLARYEGELASDAHEVYAARDVSRYLIPVALVTVAVAMTIVTVASADTDREKATGYAFAGAAALSGGIWLLLPVGSSKTRWQEYVEALERRGAPAGR